MIFNRYVFFLDICMFTMSSILRETAFLDQCQLLCLFYIKSYSVYDKDCDREDQKHLHRAVEDEIALSLNRSTCDDEGNELVPVPILDLLLL